MLEVRLVIFIKFYLYMTAKICRVIDAVGRSKKLYKINGPPTTAQDVSIRLKRMQISVLVKKGKEKEAKS